MMLTAAWTIGTLALFALEAFVVGVACYPAAMSWYAVWVHTASFDPTVRILWLCVAAAAGVFIYGFTLMGMMGLLRILLRVRVSEGEFPLLSLEAAMWGLSMALKSPVSHTFMDFIVLTPFIVFFLRLMGAKVGRGVHINSKSCADPLLLEIGDGSVVGGHATIIGHTFERGKLILKKVTIGRHVVVGLNAVILPGAVIGDGAIIAAGAVVPKNTTVAPGTVYTGASTDSGARQGLFPVRRTSLAAFAAPDRGLYDL